MTNKQKTVALITLGCKVNQFETASFTSRFKEHGVEVLPFTQKADIYVVNTCAVTGKAGSQSRQLIRRALRTNPAARIVVTGCYAQVATQDVLDLVDQPICIVGNDNKHLLVDIALSNTLCDLEIYMGDIGRKKEICDLPVHDFSDRTRAFMKIQDGCNNFCSYCIVPLARGRVRSLEPDRVLQQIAVFAQEGFRELVLTGIHVGMYGHDRNSDCTLAQLIRRILDQKHSMRYRISSLEPGELSDELLQLTVDNEELVPHFHLPLQSGDPAILKKMNRKYSAEEFGAVVDKIIQAIPDAGIGLDVLVGF
nr:MiaB/RimO family radical SAM methylthiotransferase [Desulfobulbaceae bacterium]